MSMNNIKFLLIGLVFFNCFTIFEPQEGIGNTFITSNAEKNVSYMLDELKIAMLEGSKNPKEGKKLLNDLLNKYYDSKLIAKYTTMPYWKNATESEREVFSSIFKNYLIDLASDWFEGFVDVNYLITSSELRGKSFVIVDILIIDPGTKRHNTKLSFRLKINNNNKNIIKIIDVEIENISMILIQNDEFKSIIRRNKGEFVSLIDTLKENN